MSSRGGEESARQRRAGYLLLAAAVALASGIQVVSTRRGIGLVSDSATYVQGAQILTHHPTAFYSLAHYGSVGGFSHFPPMYSLVLAVPGWLGFGIESGARWVNLLCLVVMLVALFALVARRAPTIVAGIACLALAGLGEFVQTDFSWAMSEAFYLMLLVLAVLVLDVAWEATGRRYWALIAGAGVLVGLSAVTRFLGIGVAGGTALAVLAFAPRGRRVGSAALVAVLGLIPVGLWQVLDSTSGRGARTFGVYRPSTADIERAGTSVGGWFLPERLVDPLQVLWVVAAVVGLGWALWFAARTARRTAPSPAHRLVSTALLAALGSTAIVVLGRLFYDPAVLFDRRELSALGLAMVIAATVLLAERWAGGRLAWRVVGVGVAIVMVVGALPRTADVAHSAVSGGIGYQAPVYRNSPTLAYVARLAPGTTIYSNAPDLIYLLLGRATGTVPFDVDRTFHAELAAMQATVARTHGFVVYFDTTERSSVPGPSQALPGGKVVKRFSDGEVLALPRAG